MSTEMSMNARRFSEELPDELKNSTDNLQRTSQGCKNEPSEGMGINVIRNMTFLLRGKPADGSIDPPETKGISAIRNMTFLLGKPGEEHIKSRRSMSAGYAPASTRRDGDNKKIVVGRFLTTRKLVIDKDEIDNEVHLVLNQQVKSAAKQFMDDACVDDTGGTKSSHNDENVIICSSRLTSSSYIGTDSLFPLSTIPVAENVQFHLKFEDFLAPEHITDGSNSCIYSARNRGVLLPHPDNSRPRPPESVVIKILNEEVDDMATATREFNFERDILAGIW
jgi:hypothetical protein